MLKTALSLLTILIFSLPMLLELVAPDWSTSLGGVTREKKQPKLSIESFSTGVFQQRFEKRFIGTLGVRPVLIKTDNQINFSLFRQLSSSIGGKAILGREGQLIERIYLKRSQGALAPKKKKLVAKAREIVELRDLLSQRGISLVVVVSANKPATYPEIVPALHRVSEEAVADYSPPAVLIDQLRSAEIPVLDTAKLFQSVNENERSYLFSPTGTHWSEFGSCLAASELLRLFTEEKSNFTSSLHCKRDGYRELPLPMDRDLLSVANLWWPEQLVKPAPKVVRTFTPSAVKPRVLFVGTSYLWALFYNLEKAPLFSQRDMYYYFKRSVPYPKGKEQAIDRKDNDWMEQALKSDMIVLEVNEALPHRIGYGFPKKMVNYLRNLPPNY